VQSNHQNAQIMEEFLYSMAQLGFGGSCKSVN